MNIKIIAFDLDGTVLNTEKDVTEATIEALAAAAERGIELVPSTGRFFGAIPEAIRTLPFIHYALTINGAEVVDVVNSKTIYRAGIDVPTSETILKVLAKYDAARGYYAGNAGYMDKEILANIGQYFNSPQYHAFAKKVYAPVDNDFEYLKEHFNEAQKILLFTPNHDILNAAKDEIESLDLPVLVTSSFSDNIEINDIHANKGEALIKLAEYLGADIEDVAAFGDSGNDISMIRAAGQSVAMGNATDEILAAAKFVTLTNDEDGVAAWIHKYVLEK